MMPFGADFQVRAGVNTFNECMNQGLFMMRDQEKSPKVGLAPDGSQKRKLIIA